MELLAWNALWMGWNAILAILGFLTVIPLKLAKRFWQRVLFGGVWLLFVPNSLYVLSDIKHLFRQWMHLSGWGLVALCVQFFVLITLGVIMFLLSVREFEHVLTEELMERWRLVRENNRWVLDVMLLSLLGLVAFGLVMGRVMRTNTWYVITDPVRVLVDALEVLTSPWMMAMVFAYWVIGSGLYFSFRALTRRTSVYG